MRRVRGKQQEGVFYGGVRKVMPQKEGTCLKKREKMSEREVSESSRTLQKGRKAWKTPRTGKMERK